MKILSQWILTPEEYALLDVSNRYKMHQILCGIFNESGIRYSVKSTNNKCVILIVSKNNIIKNPNIGTFASKNYIINTVIGNSYRVEVDANTIMQVSTLEHPNPRKIPIVGEQGVTKWLKNRIDKFGCNIENIQVGKTQHYCNPGNKKYNIAWHPIKFIATVTNSDKFNETVLNGIGSSKYCGLGLVKIFNIH